MPGHGGTAPTTRKTCPLLSCNAHPCTLCSCMPTQQVCPSGTDCPQEVAPGDRLGPASALHRPEYAGAGWRGESSLDAETGVRGCCGYALSREVGHPGHWEVGHPWPGGPHGSPPRPSYRRGSSAGLCLRTGVGESSKVTQPITLQRVSTCDCSSCYYCCHDYDFSPFSLQFHDPGPNRFTFLLHLSSINSYPSGM